MDHVPGGVMHSAFRVAAASIVVAAASFAIRADVTPPSQAAEIQLQLGDLLFSEGKYLDSLAAYRNALNVAPSDGLRRPRMGVIASALRVAEFVLARDEAEKLYQADPKAPDLARGHHGMAKALAARSRLDEALNEGQMALRLSPRDLEIHHTVGTIFERQHRY